MSGGYTVEQFQNDLNQLGGFIEGFYDNKPMKGGKSCRKGGNTCQKKGGKRKKSVSKRKKSKSKSKHRRSRSKHKKGGASTRAYKIIDVNGKKYPYYRRYHGAEPKDAAKKAFHFICKKLSMNKKSCKITFTLQETTRGSKKRTYGPYRGKYVELPKPRIFKPPKGKKPIKITHRRHVELIGKSAKTK